MNKEDLRKESRIPVRDLPKEYSSFTVLLPHGVEDVVHTTDASLNGFGFYSDQSPDEYILGTRLVLYPMGSEHPVYGDIVHASLKDKGTRVGVRLLRLGGYNVYQSIINEIMKKFS